MVFVYIRNEEEINCENEIERILEQVEKPARYLGNEWNMHIKI